MTNKEFAKNSPVFIHACVIAGVEATKRQASKWHNKKGRAFMFRNRALSEIARGAQPLAGS